MEQLREVALTFGSATQLARSERRLNSADGALLTVLLEQTAARYPHQDLAPAMQGYLHDFEKLALRYTLKRVMAALEELRIRPGQRFFPQPSEVAEVIEELMANERTQFLKDHPYTPCGECHDGMMIDKREDGGFVARECECKKAWRRSCEPAKSEPNYERARVQGQ